MARRSFFVAASLAIIALVSPHAQAGNTNEAYTAGLLGDAVNRCRQDNPAGINIAAACIAVSSGQVVTVRVNDDVTENVDFFWSFKDAAGNCPGEPADPLGTCPNNGFAQDHVTLSSPPGAVRLDIWLSGPVFSTLDSADTATTGTVVFTK